jgi:cell division protein ZipA
MDATTLRLILVVIGAAFLIGLYLWEKQRAEGRNGRRRMRQSRPRPKREPNLGGFGESAFDDAGPSGHGHAAEPVAHRDQPLPAASDADQSAAEERSGEAMPPGGDELLIQLYITSSGGAFSGEEILAAAERCKLRPGDMDIFHRTRGDTPEGEPLFSMANLVKPGTFPFEDMTEFASPGLAVFAQFRGEPSDLMVFDEMLDAARIMAELLGGDIRGPQREPLRDADAKGLRARVRALLYGSAEAADMS